MASFDGILHLFARVCGIRMYSDFHAFSSQPKDRYTCCVCAFVACVASINCVSILFQIALLVVRNTHNSMYDKDDKNNNDQEQE